jgi:hypothetical protein
MRHFAVILCVCLAFVPFAVAQNPGHSHAYGKSLGEWMELYWTWFLGGDQEARVGSVVFLPIPMDGEEDVTLKVGEKFVLPMLVIVGETYTEASGSPDDNPADYPLELFTAFTVKITLDGKPIIDSDVEDIADYYFEPQWFDEPVEYLEPADSGAVAAIWVTGLGFVHPPLSKGAHVLNLLIEYDGQGVYDNTWYIDVVKKK